MKRRQRSTSLRTAGLPVRTQLHLRVKNQAFGNPRIREVARLVRAACDRSASVSLREAARAAHYSPQHFSQFFHDRVGVCFETWQFAVRMRSAEEALIRKPWMQADAVARAVGYSDASAFSRAFKRYAGINWRQLKRLAFENPDIAAALITIPFLDHAYALAMFAKKNPSAISMLQRLADCLHESSVRPS